MVTPLRWRLPAFVGVAALAGCGSFFEEGPPVDIPAEPPAEPDPAELRRKPSLPILVSEPDSALLTPEDSRAARPWWGGTSYAPQPPKMRPNVAIDTPGAELGFDELLATRSSAQWIYEHAESGDRSVRALQGDLLACRARAPSVAAHPTVPSPGNEDVRLTFAFGALAAKGRGRQRATPQPTLEEDAAIEVRERDERGFFHFTAPAVNLSLGDPLTVVVRDASGRGPKGSTVTLRTLYQGRTPIRARAGNASVECRQILPYMAESLLRDALHAVDEETDRLDVHELGGVFFPDAYPRAVERVTFAASLVGWADPPLAVRLDRLAQVHRRRIGDGEAELLFKHATLPPPGTWVTVTPGVLSASVVGLSCGEEAAARVSDAIGPDSSRACLLRVRLRNDGPALLAMTARGDRLAGTRWMLADIFGRSLRLQAFGVLDVDGVPQSHPPELPQRSVTEALFAVHRSDRQPTFGSFPPLAKGDLRTVRPLMLKAGRAEGGWLRVE